mgnify:FL=1
MQVYNHTNITQAMRQCIARQEDPVKGIDKTGIEVTFVSAGTQTMPQDGTEYIKDNGEIEYFKGTEYGYTTQHAIYNDVTFSLAYEGAAAEVKVRAQIGWDTA